MKPNTVKIYGTHYTPQVGCYVLVADRTITAPTTPRRSAAMSSWPTEPSVNC
jgi:hypothetical protein